MGRINGSVQKNSDSYDFYIIWEETDINVANNTSKIKAYTEIYCGKHNAYDNSTYNHSITINGETFNTSVAGIRLSPGTYVRLATAEKTIVHNTDGSKNISISASSPNLPSGGGYGPYSANASGNVELYTIPRKSSVTCADGNIGSSTVININRASSGFKHTLEYSFNGLTGTIATKTDSISIGWNIPTSFYAKIPNSLSGSGTITCKTYNGDTLIGTSTCTFNAFVVNSNPTISATAVDTNSKTIELTGDSNKIVKYYSNAKVDITATAKNSASITERKVVAGNKNGSGTSTTLNNVETNIFNISCKDSRGLTASTKITKTLINYIKLAITKINLARPEQTSNTINISLNGNYFNNTFGAVANTLELKFRYKEGSGSFTNYTTLTPTKNNNTFSYNGELGTEFNYQKEYDFEIVVADKLMSLTYSRKVTKGIPQIDRGKNDIKYNTNIEVTGRFKGNVLNTFKREYVENNTNLDDPGVNGIFEVRGTELTYTGQKPFNGYFPFLNFKTLDNTAMFQLAGTTGKCYYRGTQKADVNMNNINWAKLRDSSNWGVVIYDNTSGTTGTVTLSKSVAEYTYIDIFFYDNYYNLYKNIRIYDPNNKKVSLDVGHTFGSSSNVRIASSRAVKISDKTIVTDSEYGVWSSADAITAENRIAITAVVGYV